MRKPFNTVGALTGAVLVALGLLLALLLAGCTGERDPRVPSTGTGVPPSPSPASKVPSGRELPGSAHTVGLAADGSGFALLAKCVADPRRPENGFCRQYVAVLDKGASKWRLRTSPLTERSGTEGVSADLRVFGSGRAWVQEWTEQDPDRSWFTADGGRSWQARDVKRVGAVRSIPKGAVLSAQCAPPAAPDKQECRKNRLMVMSPDDGRLRELKARPPLSGMLLPAAYAEPDGSWWVSGKDRATGAPAVAFSRDAGRSWTASVPNRSVGKRAWHLRVSVGEGVVYAAEMGEIKGVQDVKNPLRAIYRSRDGGLTWERTWRAGPQGEPRSLMGVLVPGPGGRLVVHAESGRFTSTDGGRTFRAAEPDVEHASTVPLGRLAGGGGCDYRTTADGVRWSAFRLGDCQG